MTAPLTIERIALIKGVGIFRDFAAPADLPPFRSQTLIYGFNGTGKTTLSRILSSVSTGAIHSKLELTGGFELQLSDGSRIKSSGPLDALKGRLLVFNEDFVEENLSWSEGKANPVFYIGKQQAELAAELANAEKALATIRGKLPEANEEARLAERAFTEYKRTRAQAVGHALHLKVYNAGHLGTDYDAKNFTPGPANLLAEDEQERALKVVREIEAPQQLRELTAEAIDLDAFTENARMLLAGTIGKVVLDDLREHQTMLNWVKQGVEYHREHKLCSCLFCGGPITDQRMETLATVIDNRFEKLCSDIGKAIERANALRVTLEQFERALPHSSRLSAGFRADYDSAADALRELISNGRRALEAIEGQLRKKAGSPNVELAVPDLPFNAAVQWDRDLAANTMVLNALIAKHNAYCDNFTKEQTDSRANLKRHLLQEGYGSYDAAKKRSEQRSAERASLSRQDQDLATKVADLKSRMKEHATAAELINAQMKNYLCHEELVIKSQEIGYRILRRGKPLKGPLSEGERTAIALCYFICQLEAEGRKPKDLIVVVDDPISSLDTRALHYAAGMIRSAMSGVAQLIILTHNQHFMNDMKGWLKNRAEKDENPSATLLCIEAIKDAQGRHSRIVEMPTLLREYESEYHYLFSHLLRFLEHGDNDGVSYLLPNAMRKLLEIFLAFKFPGNDGFTSKVRGLPAAKLGLDPARLVELDRLVQLESHANDLDDLVGLSSMNIEETRQVAEAVRDLIMALDKDHYDRLCKIVRRTWAK